MFDKIMDKINKVFTDHKVEVIMVCMIGLLLLVLNEKSKSLVEKINKREEIYTQKQEIEEKEPSIETGTPTDEKDALLKLIKEQAERIKELKEVYDRSITRRVELVKKVALYENNIDALCK